MQLLKEHKYEYHPSQFRLQMWYSNYKCAIKNYRMEAAAPEKLLEVFKVLDPNNTGYLHVDNVSRLIMDEGEPFTQEELDEMLAAAVDVQTGHIAYEFYINSLMVDA